MSSSWMFVRAHEFEFVWQVCTRLGRRRPVQTIDHARPRHAAPSHTVTNLLGRDNNLGTLKLDNTGLSPYIHLAPGGVDPA